MKYDRSFAQRIKEQFKIGDLFEHLGYTLTNKPKEAVLCPLHNENTASCYLTHEKGRFHCFGCDTAGDVFTLYQEYYGVDFSSALKSLSELAGIVRDTDQPISDDAKKQRSLWWRIRGYYSYQLHKGADQLQPKNYLKKRRINKDVIEAFNIGYARERSNALVFYLTNKYPLDHNVILNDLAKCGLVYKDKKGQFFDALRDRLIIPLFSSAGVLCGFTGRRCNDDKIKRPKYMTILAPGTTKASILFGGHNNRTLPPSEQCLWVEGYTDVMRLWEFGQHSIAIQGTAIDPNTAKHALKKYKTIILAFDGDLAGDKACFKAVQLLLQFCTFKQSIKVIILPLDQDVDDLQSSEISDVISSAIPATEWFSQYIKRHPPQQEQALDIFKDWLALIQDPIVHDTWQAIIRTELSLGGIEQQWRELWQLCHDIKNAPSITDSWSDEIIKEVAALDGHPAIKIIILVIEGASVPQPLINQLMVQSRFLDSTAKDWSNDLVQKILEACHFKMLLKKLSKSGLTKNDKCYLSKLLEV